MAIHIDRYLPFTAMKCSHFDKVNFSTYEFKPSIGSIINASAMPKIFVKDGTSLACTDD